MLPGPAVSPETSQCLRVYQLYVITAAGSTSLSDVINDADSAAARSLAVFSSVHVRCRNVKTVSGTFTHARYALI